MLWNRNLSEYHRKYFPRNWTPEHWTKNCNLNQTIDLFRYKWPKNTNERIKTTTKTYTRNVQQTSCECLRLRAITEVKCNSNGPAFVDCFLEKLYSYAKKWARKCICVANSRTLIKKLIHKIFVGWQKRSS